MSASTELDPVFRYAIKMLHSANTDSAEKIRNALDDLIKQRHGATKMLANTLNKKFIAEEALAPGSGAIQRRPSHKSIDSKASSSSSKGSASPCSQTITTITTETGGGDGNIDGPIIINVPDDDQDDDNDMMIEEDQLKVFFILVLFI